MNYYVATAFVDEPVASATMRHVAANVFVVEPVASAVVWPGTPMIPTPKATRPVTVADVVTSPCQNMSSGQCKPSASHVQGTTEPLHCVRHSVDEPIGGLTRDP